LAEARLGAENAKRLNKVLNMNIKKIVTVGVAGISEEDAGSLIRTMRMTVDNFPDRWNVRVSH